MEQDLEVAPISTFDEWADGEIVTVHTLFVDPNPWTILSYDLDGALMAIRPAENRTEAEAIAKALIERSDVSRVAAREEAGR